MEKQELEKQVDQELENVLSKEIDDKTSQKIVALFEKKKEQAQSILQDQQRMEHFYTRLERKCKRIPLIGQQLSYVPAMASLIQSYRAGDYPDIPLGAILSVMGAMIYFIAPFDIFPDGIPLLGLTDDAALIAVIWKLIGDDVEEYNRWRKKNHKD